MAPEPNTSSSGVPGPASAASAPKAESASPAHTSTQTSGTYPGLSANFADPKAPFAVNYDQEVYLQLMAGEEEAGTPAGTATKKNKSKTPTQIYREEWVRRALDPAISDPRGDPSPIDLECAENQRVRDKF
ncbi:hypothetical protein BJX61DRAFT_539298 [Aspergillus egyptiacus]|nr:hypothetical protein BJX61DRAFT_539298 [Aspergillus egyptiacus]